MLLVAFSRRMCCSRAISAPDPRQIGDMLGALGLAILEALIDRAVPAAIRITEPLALSEAKSERETVSYLRRMRNRNRPLPQLH
jgi:glycine dehydrogenase